MKKLIIIIAIFILMICFSFIQVNAPEYIPAPSPTPQLTPTPMPQEREGLDELKFQLEEKIKTINGDWGVYVKNLDTNEFLTINEHEMPSASLIKLFVMAAVYNEFNNGTKERTENIDGLIKNMICISDNDSSNTLCEFLGNGNMIAGFDVENANTKALDCTYTIQQTDLQDNRANSKIRYIGRNYTSPRDCGHLLELIYRKELYSEEYSNEMLELLKAQQRTHKIPSSLPDGTVIANKTGEMTGVENDAAIVYSPKCDYIITVMSNNVPNNDRAISNIHLISSMVYDYFND